MAGPGPTIRERGRTKKGTLKKLLKLLFKEYRAKLIISAICIIFNVITNLSGSIFANFITQALEESIVAKIANPTFNIMVDKVNIHLFSSIAVSTNIKTLIICLGSIYAIGIVASYVWNRTMAVVTQKFLNSYRIKLFSHMEELPIKYFDTHPHGDIMSIYTNDVDIIRQFISQSMPSILQTSITIIGCLFVMLTFSVWLTLIVLSGSIAMFINMKKIGGKAGKYFIKQQMSVGKLEGNIEETIQGLRVIKVFTHEDESFDQFNQINEELRNNATIANIHGNIMGPINGNIGNFVYVFCAIAGCVLYLSDNIRNLTITGGLKVVEAKDFYSMLVSFLMLSKMFSNNVNNFSQQITFIMMGMAGASRCFDLLSEEQEKDEGYVTLVHIKKDKDGNIIETNENTRYYAWKHPHGDGTLTYTELKGDIVIDNIDFSYDGKRNVLEDISIYAKPGQKIAFVGATGAGKTTITNLINRFYDVADGKIRYDGINITKIKKDDLRKSLGIVLQDTSLFTGTVMENIRYGRLDATDEECIEASKIANAYDFITRLPNGFDTLLAGDGSTLSQGQRQLIAIARAAVANAPVMILDEATSSIDTRTEKLVQEGMDKIMEGRTTFVIAHRLSTVQNAKAIMVLDHGHIIERGTHEQLIDQKGTYYQLYTGAFELE